MASNPPPNDLDYTPIHQSPLLSTLLSHLHPNLQVPAMTHILHFSPADIHLFRSRLSSLSAPDSCTLLALLRSLSSERLLRVLSYLTANPQLPRRNSNQPPSRQDVDAARHYQKYLASRISLDAILELPTDVFCLILEKFYEAIFLPGEVMPEQSLVKLGEDIFLSGEYLRSTNDPQLLWYLKEISPRLWEEYKGRYWSENTIVPAPGPANRTLWSRPRVGHLPAQISLIRSVRLVLSTHDKDAVWDYYHDDVSPLLNVQKFLHYSAIDAQSLPHIWMAKFRVIAELEGLERLVLDLRDACAPDGEWLGGKWLELGAGRFSGGMPRVLEVLAPSEEMAGWVRGVIEDVNRVY